MINTSQKKSVIEFHNVSYVYPKTQLHPARIALRNINCKIYAGEYICVLGTNGSGKSTFAQLINGLLLPTHGKIITNGYTTSDVKHLYDIRSKTSLIFQQPQDQLVASTCADDVAFGPENLALDISEIKRRVNQSLANVDMQEHAHENPHRISGGQQQRVAIAGSLAMHPKILVLDEPAAMLDNSGHREINRIISVLRQQGITIIHITHFMDDACNADRLFILGNGTIKEKGTPADIFSRPNLPKKLGLELPHIYQLEQLLQKRNILSQDFLNTFIQSKEQEKFLVQTIAESIMNLDVTSKIRTSVNVASFSIGKSREPSCTSKSKTPTDRDNTHTNDEKPTPALTFENVYFSYKKTSHIKPVIKNVKSSCSFSQSALNESCWSLNNINFSLEKGSFTVLVGHTGSGKSTALHLATGLKKPSRGNIYINGKNIANKHIKSHLFEHIGYVMQSPERQLFAKTIYDDIAFGLHNLNLHPLEIDKRVKEVLARVGIDVNEARTLSPYNLSGGEQRLVAIAGVLVMNPSILVLDEPLAGLDPKNRENVKNLLIKLHQHGMTILMTTHSMDTAAQLADTIILFNHGEKLLQESSGDFFQHTECLSDLKFNMPASIHLTKKLQQAGVPIKSIPKTIDELANELFCISHNMSCPKNHFI